MRPERRLVEAPPSATDAASWRIAKACVRGTAHRAQGEECQDRFVAEEVRSGCGEVVAVAAVADGAGSASHSGPGAQVAVDGFIDCIVAALKDARVAELPDEAPRAWLRAMRRNVLEEAAKAGRPVQEYACTFLAVVAGEEAGIFLQLGDGLIAVRGGDAATWEVACTPQRGEYVNQTWFLTSADALERAEIRRWNGRISDIAATTDGLENVCLDRKTGQPFQDFFDGLMATVLATPVEQEDQLDAGLARFLENGRLDEYTSDDKTLVLAARLRG
ncbi:MAG: PP2C family serine/threonine-protein phosphatase [Rhodopila sp.]|jgi:hypothetical protein